VENFIKTNSQKEFIETVCEIIKEEANKNIKEKGSFTFVLSGGRTPKDIFDELVLNHKESIKWNKVHFFWLDERCVDPLHEDSNYKLAYDSLISKLDVVGSVHRIKAELSPIKATKEYEINIKKFFNDNVVQFDLVLLGLGEDGHVASLFSDSKELKLRKKIVLNTENRYGGYYRITLGLDTINKSHMLILLINNSKKLHVYQNIDKKLRPINFINKGNLNVVIRNVSN